MLIWMWRCRLPLRCPWRTLISWLPWLPCIIWYIWLIGHTGSNNRTVAWNTSRLCAGKKTLCAESDPLQFLSLGDGIPFDKQLISVCRLKWKKEKQGDRRQRCRVEVLISCWIKKICFFNETGLTVMSSVFLLTHCAQWQCNLHSCLILHHCTG